MNHGLNKNTIDWLDTGPPLQVQQLFPEWSLFKIEPVDAPIQKKQVGRGH